LKNLRGKEKKEEQRKEGGRKTREEEGEGKTGEAWIKEVNKLMNNVNIIKFLKKY